MEVANSTDEPMDGLEASTSFPGAQQSGTPDPEKVLERDGPEVLVGLRQGEGRASHPVE